MGNKPNKCNEQLYYAAKAGKLKKCQALILNKADANWENPKEVV